MIRTFVHLHLKTTFLNFMVFFFRGKVRALTFYNFLNEIQIFEI